MDEVCPTQIWEYPILLSTGMERRIGQITDEQLRIKFKEFMQICRLPQLTVHSWRYICATKLYLRGVSPDAIKDILGVDKRTLKYYIKAVQERKKIAS